jgi:hypothetical protein
VMPITHSCVVAFWWGVKEKWPQIGGALMSDDPLKAMARELPMIELTARVWRSIQVKR